MECSTEHHPLPPLPLILTGFASEIQVLSRMLHGHLLAHTKEGG